MNDDVKKGFAQFLAQQGTLLHCTAHSHHPWPDCTQHAHAQAWLDAACHTDAKWGKVFDEVLPQAQTHIARELQLSSPEQIVFAPNTHEFVVRLYSCLSAPRPLKVLCTASEFHSFTRQTRRLEEAGLVQVTRIAMEPYASFTERFTQAARSADWDLMWLSLVPFDSGYVVQGLEGIINALPKTCMAVVDGYHAYMAMPVNWQPFEHRAFFVAGGYKYAMAGEGACFLVVPKSCTLRPISTGWFADFDGLDKPQAATSPVGYAANGARFFGATFDPSALYRFNAVQRWLQSLGLSSAHIHAHVQQLQRRFLEALTDMPHLSPQALTPPAPLARGNFLCFDIPHAHALEQALAAAQIRVDRRGTRLRFGFGLYHDLAFIEHLLHRLSELRL
jgi:kynureninase